MKRHIVITQKKTDYAMPRSIHTAYRMNFQLITLTCKEIKNESDLCFYYCAANITTHLNVQTAEDNVVSRRTISRHQNIKLTAIVQYMSNANATFMCGD